jgi:UDP-N-acetylglucosamine acyltransferase
MTEIHPQAFVDPKAEIGDDVRVGPFCHVGPNVRLDDGCELLSHVTLLGPSRFGPRNLFYPHCTIGADPQDLKYKGGPTSLVVGGDNVFRENVTVHRGTEVDQCSAGETRIGNHSLFMVGVHLAHDACVGDHVILANQVQIAGHVRIEDRVNVGGASAMHHFVTVGTTAFIGGMTRITHDVPPYMKVVGYDAAVRAVNVEGMRRWKLPESSISAMKDAFRLLYVRRGEHSRARMVDALREIEADGLIHDDCVRRLFDFLRRKLDKGVYGRSRERERSDQPADRDHFYRAAQTETAS